MTNTICLDNHFAKKIDGQKDYIVMDYLDANDEESSDNAPTSSDSEDDLNKSQNL